MQHETSSRFDHPRLDRANATKDTMESTQPLPRSEPLTSCTSNEKSIWITAAENGQQVSHTRGCICFFFFFNGKNCDAGVLSLAWLMYLRMYNMKCKLKQLRATHLEAHRDNVAELRTRWNTIQQSKRTIIHLASQGYSQPVRETIPKFHIEQSLQLGRICDIQGQV